MGIFRNKAGDSLARERRVCGYRIRKLPLGAYISACDRLESAALDFFGQAFPGDDMAEILARLSTIGKNGMMETAAKILAAAPDFLIGLVSELSEIPEERLRNDEMIGLDGFAEIILAFLEVNRLPKFAASLGELKAAITAARENIGFKDLSRAD